MILSISITKIGCLLSENIFKTLQARRDSYQLLHKAYIQIYCDNQLEIKSIQQI